MPDPAEPDFRPGAGYEPDPAELPPWESLEANQAASGEQPEPEPSASSTVETLDDAVARLSPAVRETLESLLRARFTSVTTVELPQESANTTEALEDEIEPTDDDA
ncbi:MAG: hypothetical protein ACFB21_14070 [Opitutales bacterium]